jgi:hypothetical protein
MAANLSHFQGVSARQSPKEDARDDSATAQLSVESVHAGHARFEESTDSRYLATKGATRQDLCPRFGRMIVP